MQYVYNLPLERKKQQLKNQMKHQNQEYFSF